MSASGRTAYVVALSLALVPASAAQDASCLHRTLPVAVADREMHPIKGLTAADFQGEYRGQPVKILSVSLEDRPHRIVILVDASGSIGTPGWDLARALALHIAQSRLPKTTLALLIFNDKVTEKIDFSEGANAVADRLLQIGGDPSYAKNNVRGSTALLDTILAGFHLLTAPSSADVIYVISDGGENGSRSSPAEVEHSLVSAGVRLFSAAVVSPIGQRCRTPEELNGPAMLEDTARATGGSLLGPFDVDALGDARQRAALASDLGLIYQRMLDNYRMEVEFPQPVDKWREWKLELTDQKKHELKKIELAYPRELAPCKAPAAN